MSVDRYGEVLPQKVIARQCSTGVVYVLLVKFSGLQRLVRVPTELEHLCNATVVFCLPLKGTVKYLDSSSNVYKLRKRDYVFIRHTDTAMTTRRSQGAFKIGSVDKYPPVYGVLIKDI